MTPARAPLRIPAIALVLVAILFGSLLDAMIKDLGARYSAVLIACGRFVAGSVFALATFVLQRRPMPSAATLRNHGVRALASTASAVLFFHALGVLPLAEATVLMFCAPVMIAPMARLLLGERLRPMALAAVAIGFLGVLVTIQGASGDGDAARRLEGVLAGLGGAVLYALSIVLLRQLAQRDDALLTSMLGNVFPALYLLIPAIALGQAPAAADLPEFAALGAMGFGLWFLMSRAYAQAPAQALAPAEYSGLIWSALLGFLLFHETPRWQVFAGGAVICAAILLAALSQPRTRPAAVDSAP